MKAVMILVIVLQLERRRVCQENHYFIWPWPANFEGELRKFWQKVTHLSWKSHLLAFHENATSRLQSSDRDADRTTDSCRELYTSVDEFTVCAQFLMSSNYSTGSDTFTSRLLRCWQDFLASCKSFYSISENEEYSLLLKEFTETEFTNVIRVTLSHLISPSHITSVNHHEIVAYYFFKALLTSGKSVEGESDDGMINDGSSQDSLKFCIFKKTFCIELFLKIECILEKLLDEVSRNVITFPISCICSAVGLISDLLRDSSLTSLLLHHLEEVWNNWGTLIKKLIEYIMNHQNGIANNDQEVFLFDTFRLWRTALKAHVKVNSNTMESKHAPIFTTLVDVLYVCLVGHFRIYSKCPVEVPSSLWPNHLVRSLRTVYKLVNKSEHLTINTQQTDGFDEASLFQPDPALSLRIIILCGLENSLKLDPNDAQFWSLLNSIYKLILNMELCESNIDHVYENSVISLFSGDDVQLFRALDLWIQIENRITSVESHQKNSVNPIPNAHWLFACLSKSIGFSSYLFVDWLVSPETICLSYLVHYLRKISDENEIADRSNHSMMTAILSNSWPLKPLEEMLRQIAKCLEILDKSKGIAFCPKP
ncbi:unnamed protein product [Heterobilharzia americana]|nr:unnamed protein product [Heterobilharzia americana]